MHECNRVDRSIHIRLSERKIRELMRLKYELGRSHREIAASLGIANSTVTDLCAAGWRGGILVAAAGGVGRRRAGAARFPAPPPSRGWAQWGGATRPKAHHLVRAMKGIRGWIDC